MSERSGYTDDLDPKDLARYRGTVTRAINGKRGQQILRDLVAALDAMPEPVLIAHDLVNDDGDRCALGVVGQYRGLDEIGEFDPQEHRVLGAILDIAPCLAAEIEYENDGDWRSPETPRERWTRMRAWAVDHIREDDEP